MKKMGSPHSPLPSLFLSTVGLLSVILHSPALGTNSALQNVLQASVAEMKGHLEYLYGDMHAETVLVSPEKHTYAVGLVFDKEDLPQAFRATSEGSATLVGLYQSYDSAVNVPSAPIAQFATFVVLTDQWTSASQTFRLDLPKVGTRLVDWALLSFTTPGLGRQASSAEQLKNTFYGNTGFLKGHLEGATKLVRVASLGAIASTDIRFDLQILSLELNTALVNPFLSEQRRLKGTLQVPLLRAHGKEAHSYVHALVRGNHFMLSPSQPSINRMSPAVVSGSRLPASKEVE